MQAEDGNAAGAEDQNGLARLERMQAVKRIPGGDGGTGERRRLLVGDVVGDQDEALLVEHDILRKYAVDRAAEGCAGMAGFHVAAHPALHENARDPVAGLHAGDILAGFNDLARAIRQRHEVRWHGAAHVATGGDRQVAEIQRSGVHANQHLSASTPRRLRLGERQVIEAGLPGKAIKAHGSCLLWTAEDATAGDSKARRCRHRCA